MLEVTSFPHPILGTTYIVSENGKAAIFDMGLSFDTASSYLKRHELSLEAIYITHGHYDHIVGLKDAKIEVPISMGSADIPFLSDPSLNLGEDMFGNPLCLDILPSNELSGGETLLCLGHKMEVIATPFHTPGSLCFYFPDDHILFSGDTIFRLSVGRTDLPLSCPRFMGDSLAKIKKLPSETTIYCGHGPKTKLSFELAYNPYL